MISFTYIVVGLLFIFGAYFLMEYVVDRVINDK